MATTGDNFIDKTNPNPYAQAIFLSQKIINNGFSAMWDAAQREDDEDNPLKYFSYTVRGGDFLKFKVGRPTVSLQVTTEDPMLYFQLRMTEGEVLLYLTDDPDDDSKINWDIKNWIFAFSVTIARKEVTKDSKEYQEFKERAGLPNSNFTLAALFIDASSTTKWEPDLSEFGDKNDAFRNLTPEARATFDSFIQRWLNVMKEKGKNILGYSAERQEDDELNEYAPTFPPTSIDYYCYPWKGSDGSQAPKDNIEFNALSYLMMCNFDSPPAGGAIEYTGPWVDNGDREGTFVMNCDLFWPWMQGLMRKLVIDMVPYPDTPMCYWDDSNDPDHPFRSRIEYHTGDDAAEDSQYQFSPQWWKPNTWWLIGPSRHSEIQVANPNDSRDTMKLQEDTKNTTASLGFRPGGQVVDLSGSTTFVFRADHSTRKFSTWTEMTFGISWSMSIAMASVEDGGLQFKIVQGSDKVNVSQNSSGNMSWSPPPQQIAETFKNRVQGGMESALSGVGNYLLYGLADQQRLFLPGKGSYLMKNPIFNSRGDLLVDLHFNGADPPKQRKRHLRSV
ncbi:hypothetical protein AO1008_02874 [Aspergillus oryzae 100-8]|uniref:Uncharacterized protein n=1 Tax=Aspergillus oryzae (strain 3.042) TaxID=1160506 RepID=I8U330_ASPO3|nr:hypothetical protein Ao3042_02270 [Aspergillus oryzae 3.042]KDE85852.1 hypothetical protein AO1008_02874 [Aspergillus oryzae 100-8]|eukprot:EIT81230.1 hypothetical protein Ao3042_02270 [Aspergillus oryzae 3.042]